MSADQDLERGIIITVKGPEKTIEAVGYQGSSCMEATKRLLGDLAPDEPGELKPEWHENTGDQMGGLSQELTGGG